MQLNPYLNFDGRCQEAFKFYEQALGGKILFMMTNGESPMADQTPAEWRDKIMHATMTVGDRTLMASDVPPGQYVAPTGFAVSLHVGDVAEAERLFNALAQNGTVQLQLQKTFWSAGFGMLVDQFGIPWMVNCEQAA